MNMLQAANSGRMIALLHRAEPMIARGAAPETDARRPAVAPSGKMAMEKNLPDRNSAGASHRENAFF
jgi:hypothetical protein